MDNVKSKYFFEYIINYKPKSTDFHLLGW